MADPIEEIIKQGLKGRETDLPAFTGGCPTEKELWDYLNGSVKKETEEEMGEHLVQCHRCLESLLLAQEVRPGIGFGPSEAPRGEVVTRAVDLAKKRRVQKSLMKKHLWLILSLFFIAVSFFFPRYFFQCLTVGILFGAKWVFDTATTRTLIVMYEALKKKSDGEASSREVRQKIEKEK